MYLLDTNAFLTPAKFFYAFDICSGYWDWLAQKNAEGDVASIEHVKRELRNRDDQIRRWVDFRAEDFFLPMDAGIGRAMTAVAHWAANAGYTPQATAEFLSKADAFLVAFGLAQGHSVVSLEVRRPGSVNTIKIPDACDAHGVACFTPYEMLRREGGILGLN